MIESNAEGEPEALFTLTKTELDEYTNQIATLTARLTKAQEECDKIGLVVDHLMKDRAEILNVKTTDGLTSSEWTCRTGHAEAQIKTLTTQLQEAEILLQKWVDSEGSSDSELYICANNTRSYFEKHPRKGE